MWAEAIAGLAELSKSVFAWATGGREKDQNRLRDEADHWKEAYDKAMRAGDFHTATHCMQQLRLVRDKARAQRGA